MKTNKEVQCVDFIKRRVKGRERQGKGREKERERGRVLLVSSEEQQEDSENSQGSSLKGTFAAVYSQGCRTVPSSQGAGLGCPWVLRASLWIGQEADFPL